MPESSSVTWTYCHCCMEPQVLQAKTGVDGEEQNVLTLQSFKSIGGRPVEVCMPCSEPETLVASATVFNTEGGFILLRLLGMMQMSTKDEGLLSLLRRD